MWVPLLSEFRKSHTTSSSVLHCRCIVNQKELITEDFASDSMLKQAAVVLDPTPHENALLDATSPLHCIFLLCSSAGFPRSLYNASGILANCGNTSAPCENALLDATRPLHCRFLLYVTMRYTICGIPNATLPTHFLGRIEHHVIGLLQLSEF